MGCRLYQQDVCPGREALRGEQRERALAEGQACLGIAELKNGQYGAERGNLTPQVLQLLALGRGRGCLSRGRSQCRLGGLPPGFHGCTWGRKIQRSEERRVGKR